MERKLLILFIKVTLVTTLFLTNVSAIQTTTPIQIDNSEWTITHTTDYDYFTQIDSKGSKKTEICLLSYTIDKQKDLPDKDLFLNGINNEKVTKKQKDGYWGYCYTTKDEDNKVRFGTNSTTYEWLNNTFYIYPETTLQIEPFTLEVLFDGVLQEYPNLNWTSDEEIDVGVPFELRVENFTQRDNVTFRQNKLVDRTCVQDNQFLTTCDEYHLDFSKFEAINNITNKTVDIIYDMDLSTWEQFKLFFRKIFGYEPAENEYRDIIGYDITYYGDIIDLDPSLEYTFTSSEYGFYNQTEGSSLGASLEINDSAWTLYDGDRISPYLYNEGDYKSFIFYNSTSSYWNTTLSLADSDGSAGINSSDERLIFYYPMDGNYDDATGNYPNTATPSTAEPKNSTGISSGALDFSLNSRDDRVYSYDTLDPNTEFTGCSWVFHHNIVEDSYIFQLGDVTDGFLLWRDVVGSTNGRSNSYKAFVADYSSTNTAEIEGAEGIAPEDEWVHICYTYISDDSEGLRLYINGVEDENSPADTTGITTLNAEAFYLGCSNAVGCSDALDEYLFYNTSLTDSEIQELYKAGLSQHANANVTLETRTADSYNISDAGLVGLWGLNSNTSSVAIDETGNNNGTWTNGAMPLDESGVVGMGGEFDGVNDYVDVGMADEHLGNTFSVSAWIYYTMWNYGNYNSYYQSIMAKGSIFGGEGRELILEFRERNDGGAGGSIGLRTSLGVCQDTDAYITHPGPRWLHVVGVWSDGDQRLYFDGELVAANDIEGTPVSNAETLKIGSPSSTTINDRRYNGSIDEVRIYNRSLSADEVQNLYELGSHHIEWNAWQNQEVVKDLIPQGSTDSGKFFQYKSVFETNDTDVSPYLINYTVGVGSQYGEVEDTTPPTWTTIPADDSITYGTNWTGADFDATDDVDIDTYFINDTTNFLINSTGYLDDKIILDAGTYSINVSVNDTSGNINSTTYSLTVNKAGNILTLDITPSTTESYGTETSAICSADNGTPDLFRNNSAVSNPDTQTLGAGTYNYICNISESTNYLANSTSLLLTINKATGQVELYLDGARASETVEVNTEVAIVGNLTTGTFGTLNLTIDEVEVNSSSSTNLTYTFQETGLGNYIVNLSYTGNENYTLSSESWTITYEDTGTTTVTTGSERCYYQSFGKYDSSIKSFMRMPYGCFE